MFPRTWQKRITVVKFWQNEGTEEGFCSINSEIATDVTNSPNFYVDLPMLVTCFSTDRLLVSDTPTHNASQLKKRNYFASHFSVSFCSLTRGITPKKTGRLRVCVLINKHSFEPFMGLDLVSECWRSFLFQIVAIVGGHLLHTLWPGEGLGWVRMSGMLRHPSAFTALYPTVSNL